MAIDIKIIDGGRGVLSTGTGTLDESDVFSILDTVMKSDGGISKVKYFLDDFSDVESVDITPAAVRSLVKRDQVTASLRPDIVVAVVSKGELLFGLSRMYQMLVDVTNGEQPQWQVFTTKSLVEAKQWIAAQTGIVVE